MIPPADVFRFLGISGRWRYPSDLATPGLKEGSIEISDGVWVNLPPLRDSIEYTAFESLGTLPLFAVEKVHPHFLRGVEGDVTEPIWRLRERVDLKIVYQCRDPLSTFRSFKSYQKRNRGWYARIDTDSRLLAHMAAAFRDMYTLVTEIPGLIVDYSGLKEQFESEMLRVFAHVWGRAFRKRRDAECDLLRAVAIATDLERRRKAAPAPFFGNDAQPMFPAGAPGKWSSQDCCLLYDECGRLYEAILAKRTRRSGLFAWL